MGRKHSIARDAYLRLVKLSVLFTGIIISALLFISLFFFKANQITSINRSMNQTLNQVFSFELQSNYELVIKKLKEKTSLQDIAIYDNDCNLLAFTSLAISSPHCPVETNLTHLKTFMGEQELNVYYHFAHSFLETLQENILAIIVITLVTFLITVIALALFLKFSFFRPITIIQDQVEKGAKLSLPKEFDFLSSKLAELKETISRAEKDKTYFELARRVVHDIRNPISFLNMHLEENALNRTLLKEKVEEIEYQVSNLLSGSKIKQVHYRLDDFLKSTTKTLEYSFKVNISLTLKMPETTSIILNRFDLNNILSNLVRNSKEAGATSIQIRGDLDKAQVQLEITDDGHGIPQEIKQKIFTKNFTTKKDGNGIGLASLRELLCNHGGDLELAPTSQDENGAKFFIRLPLHTTPKEVIYIDNDRYLRMGWTSAGQSAGTKVHVFASVNEFLLKANNFSPTTSVYVDSDLGQNLKGEILSKQIFDLGFSDIKLATSFTDIDLSSYPWITALVPKEPPFLT